MDGSGSPGAAPENGSPCATGSKQDGRPILSRLVSIHSIFAVPERRPNWFFCLHRFPPSFVKLEFRTSDTTILLKIDDGGACMVVVYM
jgi:hypothetical protein